MGGGDGCDGEGLSPCSGLMCEVFNQVGQGNFTFVRKNSGKSQQSFLKFPEFFLANGKFP